MPKIFKDKDNNVLYTGYETSEVVANPTLEGTEANLTGLQVGDTKYAVGGSGSAKFYRFGIDFRMNSSDYDYVDYIVVCDTTEDISTLDYRDTNNFNKFVELVRGGNLVILADDGEPVHMGVVCSPVTFGSTEFQIKMLTAGAPISSTINVNSTYFTIRRIYYGAPYQRETETNE